MLFFYFTHNVLRVCAVADQKLLPFRLAQYFLGAQTFDLPLHPLLPHTRCYRFGVLFRPLVFSIFAALFVCPI
jgi:hypothetical protein